MYKTKNLINNKLVESKTGKTSFIKGYTGEKLIEYPDSDESDLSFAFKVAVHKADQIKNRPIREIIEAIKKTGKNYLADPEIRKQISQTTGSPISYINYMTDHLRKWMINIEKFVAEQFGSVENLEKGVPISGNHKKTIYTPGGVTSVLLAGDEVGLAGFVITQALLSRNPLIVRPSTKEAISSFELVKELAKNGLGEHLQVVHWNHKTSPELIDNMVKNSEQVVIFGNTSTVNKIVRKEDENGHTIEDYRLTKNIISYTSGKSTSIVLEDADIEQAAKGVVIGAVSNRGNECTNTKKVYVDTKIYTEFVNQLKKMAQKIKFGNPLHERTDLGYVGASNVKTIKSYAEMYKPLKQEFEENGMNLLMLEDSANSSAFTLQEMPGPTLSIIKTEGLADAISKTNQALQGDTSTVTAVFTNNEENLKRLFRELNTHKINVNKPSTYMDFMLPHHGKNLLKSLFNKKCVDWS